MLHLPNCKNKPFAVQWRIDGKRKTKNFATEAAQVKFAKGKVAEVKSHGTDALRLDGPEIAAWRAFRGVVGESASLSEVAECWRKYGGGKPPAITVAKAIEKMTEAKKAEGVVPTTIKHYVAVHRRLIETMGERPIDEVTREDVAAWIAGLVMEPWSVRTHFIRVRSLFTWLRVNRHLTHSPCDGMKAPRITAAEVGILTIEQARELFGAKNCAASRELMGRLALEAFAGLRFSSAALIGAGDIQEAEGGIVLAAAKIKTRRRQFIDGLPDNLWAWLKWSKPDEWKMQSAHDYMHAKSMAFVRAGVANTGNVLRHSFCTYHIAAHKDASRTSVILCHSSPKMLYQHYRGNAAESQGRAWFEIQPPR